MGKGRKEGKWNKEQPKRSKRGLWLAGAMALALGSFAGYEVHNSIKSKPLVTEVKPVEKEYVLFDERITDLEKMPEFKTDFVSMFSVNPMVKDISKVQDVQVRVQRKVSMLPDSSQSLVERLNQDIDKFASTLPKEIVVPNRVVLYTGKTLDGAIHLVDSAVIALKINGTYDGTIITATQEDKDVLGEASGTISAIVNGKDVRFELKRNSVFISPTPSKKNDYVELLNTTLNEYLHLIASQKAPDYVKITYDAKPVGALIPEYIDTIQNIEEGVVHSAVLLYLAQNPEYASFAVKKKEQYRTMKEYALVPDFFDAMQEPVNGIMINPAQRHLIVLNAWHQGNVVYLLQGKEGLKKYAAERMKQ